MAVEIRQITEKADLRKFVKFNLKLYKGNPYHVPGLIEDELLTLDPARNPAFKFCEAAYFLAYRDGRIVGRIAGVIKHRPPRGGGRLCLRLPRDLPRGALPQLPPPREEGRLPLPSRDTRPHSPSRYREDWARCPLRARGLAYR